MMKRLITIAIFFVLSLALGWFLVLPEYNHLLSLEKQIGEKRTELQFLKEYLAKLKEVAGELENYQSQLSKIDSALPDSPQLPLLFDFLQKRASQAGLVLKEIKVEFSKAKEKEKLQETRLNLTLFGSYPSFKDFLSTLEKSARLFEIQSISFSSTKEGSFNFDLEIKVYNLPI